MKKTNKKVKRVLALFLAMMMCLSMLNLTAFAEEGEGTAQPGESQAQVEASTTPIVTDASVTNEDTSTQPEVKPEEATPNTDAETKEPAGDEVKADSQPADSNTQDPAGDAQVDAPGADGVTTPDDQSAGSGNTGDSETGNEPAGGQDTGNSGNGAGTDNEEPAGHEHVWEDGACTVEGCSETCEHAAYDPATGKCMICDVVCEHSYNAEEPDGKCTVCGSECPHEKHDPETAKCEVCGFVCEHEYDEETARCKVCDALDPEATHVSVKTVEEFTTALQEPNYQVINLEGDIQLSDPLTINRSVTIQGTSTLTVDNLFVKNAAVVSLENVTVTGWLKVGGADATLTVGSSVHANGMMAYDGGTLIMNEGAGTTRVSVQNSSSFLMNGGSITAENSTCVYLVSGSTFTMNAGEINGSGSKMGVEVHSDCTFQMNDGTISNASIGVSTNDGTFQMTGGTIRGCSALDGAGVYAMGGTVNISGGSITGNTAEYYGGGILADSNAAVFISGGSITGNTAGDHGGGIYVYDGTVTVSGGTISGNTVTGSNGGGIYAENAAVIISGGSITGNTAKSYGGGIGVSYKGTVTVSGGTISGNTATKGGGIFLNTGSLAVSGGSISNNTTELYGGGIYAQYGSLTVSGGSISNNTAKYGGGICYYGMTTNISGGSITGNQAGASGGGVYYWGTSTLSLSGDVTLQGNTAMYGGAVYVSQGGKFYMYGGTIDGNTASNGGGIFVQINAEAHVNAGAITNNTATCEVENDETLYPYGGGGIYVNGGKSGTNGILYLKNVAVTDNTAGEGAGEKEKYYAGAGLSACPTSNTKIYITSGGIIAGNMPGKDGKPISQVFVDSREQSGEHGLFLSKYALGGGVYNWTDKDGKPLDDAGQMLDLAGGDKKVNAFSDLKVNLDVLKGVAGVVISGNTSKYSGGGIGSNGDVIIGSDKAILPIRKVVSGNTDETEFKFDVTMTLGGESYTGPVVVNGTNVNNGGSFTLTLKAGETQVLTDMEAGVAYTITEQESGADHVTVNGENGSTFSGITQLESSGQVVEVVFTNTYEESAPTPPPTDPPVVVTRNLTVNKVWVGDEEAEDARPDSIQVQLYQNGAAYGSPVTLNAANAWSHTWIGLPTVGDLTVEELNVPDGYIASTEISGSTVTITNTFEEDEIEDPDTPLGTPKPEATPTPTPVPASTPTPTPEPSEEPDDDEPIEDPDVPLGPAPEEPTPTPVPTTKPTPVPEEEIPDSDVPLANTPKTGDDTNVWFLLTVISAAGLVFLGASEWKKRKGDHKA